MKPRLPMPKPSPENVRVREGGALGPAFFWAAVIVFTLSLGFFVGVVFENHRSTRPAHVDLVVECVEP